MFLLFCFFKKKQVHKSFPLLFMFANRQTVFKIIENIVLDNFRSTDLTVVY